MDPDLKRGEVNTEAPTASRMSLHVLLFLAAQFGWKLAAGDVEQPSSMALSLNGDSTLNLHAVAFLEWNLGPWWRSSKGSLACRTPTPMVGQAGQRAAGFGSKWGRTF